MILESAAIADGALYFASNGTLYAYAPPGTLVVIANGIASTPVKVWVQ